MKREAKDIRFRYQLLLCFGLAILAAGPVLAQVPVDELGNPITPLEQDVTLDGDGAGDLPLLAANQLEDLVGPIALYPDDLLAIVLPASTYPLQIVQAARFLERLKADSSLKPDEEWDESVTALLNYPEVVELMNEDIDWTWRLGEAVVAQQADVISAIEAFRDKAYAAGNLKSDEHQTVTRDDGVIEIEPAQEDVIYVPYYEPERVVVYQPYPVYHYYPRAYPLYYYPYPYGYSFASHYFWGVTTAFSIGWLTDHLHVYHHSYWGHPYYGHHYHNHYYYRRPTLSVFNRYYVYNSHSYWNYRYRDGDYWRPHRHGGARPGHYSQRMHYYRDRSRDDWRHHRERQDALVSDSYRSTDGHRSGFQGDHDRNRSDYRGGNRGRDDGYRSHNGRSGDRTSGSSDNNTIRFRARDTVAHDRRNRVNSSAAQRGANRDSDLRTGFAPNSRRPTTSVRTPRPSRETQADRQSSTRPVVRTPSPRTVTPSRVAPERIAPQRSAPQRSAPQRQAPQRTAPSRPSPARSAPQRSAPVHVASAPSTPRRSAQGSSRSESRSSRASSRGSSGRSEDRSRRH